MNTKRAKQHPSRQGWWWKILIGLAVLMGVTAIALVLSIDPIAHTLANRSLLRFLPSGGTLDDIDIQLGDGVVEMTGLTIRAPQGFGDEPLLTLGAVRVDVDPLSLADDEIVVEQLIVRELALVVVRDQNGQLSPLKLLPPAEADSEETETDGERVEPGPPVIPPIRVEKIRLEKVSVRVINHLAGGEWSARMGIELGVDDLQLRDALQQDILVGRLQLAVHDVTIDQPEGFGRAPLLSLDNCKLTAAGVDLGTSRLPIDKLLLERLTTSVERDQKGETNVQRLIDAWISPASESEPPPLDEIEAGASAAGDEPPASVIPTLVVKDIQLKSLAFQVLDVIDGHPWRAGFDNLDVGVTELKVRDVAQKEVSLGTFALDLNGVTVDQPPGYDLPQLAGFEQCTVRTGKLDLSASELVVKTINIKEPSAALMVRADGESNLQKLKTELLGEPAPTDASTDVPGTGKTEAETGEKLPVVRFDQIQVTDGSIYYRDNAISKKGLEIPLHNWRFGINGLSLFGGNEKAAPASVSGSFELQQPGKLPVARFGTEAVVGPVSKVPSVNAQIRLVGFKLDTLGNIIPPATRTALGGTGFDAGVAMALDHNSIDLRARVVTDRSVRYNAMHVYGPVDKPALEIADIFSGAFNRLTDGLFNLGGDTFDAGLSIAKSGVTVMNEVGSGVWDVGKNLGVSVFEMGTGLLTLDGEEFREGLEGATGDTMSLTTDSVEGAQSAAGHGLDDSIDGMAGHARVRAWEMAVPERYLQIMQQAQEMLARMPYPPVVD